MVNYDALAAKDQVNDLFDKIEAVLDSCGPIRMFPESLLKARIDALSLLLLIDLEMVEVGAPKRVSPALAYATP